MRVAFALVLVFPVTAPAFADTPDGAWQHLIAAKLSPNPLFPTYVPPVLESAKADVTHHGPLFDFEYTKCCDSAGALTLIIDFGGTSST